jgi:hypothetical protein
MRNLFCETVEIFKNFQKFLSKVMIKKGHFLPVVRHHAMRMSQEKDVQRLEFQDFTPDAAE